MILHQPIRMYLYFNICVMLIRFFYIIKSDAAEKTLIVNAMCFTN